MVWLDVSSIGSSVAVDVDVFSAGDTGQEERDND